MQRRLLLLLALMGLSAVGATCKGGDAASTAPPPATSKELLENAAAPPPVADLEGVELARVPPAYRGDALRLLNESFCYCGCARTVASCLSQRENCSCVECSERMADFVIDAYERGASTSDVESSLIEGFSEAYNATPHDFDDAEQPTLGPSDAAHTLVEFADFRCPHCRGAFADLVQFVQSRPDVRLVYYYFPLSGFGEVSLRAARAAEAARVQGKFWEMATLLYENQTALEETDILGYAENLGLDVAQFKEALGSDTTEQKVLADKGLGTSVGVEATPQVFLDGRPLGFPHERDSLALRVAMEGDRSACN